MDVACERCCGDVRCRPAPATAHPPPAPRRGAATDLAPKGERRALGDGAATGLAQKILPLGLAVSEDAPPRVNLLIPTIDLEHLFGGLHRRVQPGPASGRSPEPGYAWSRSTPLRSCRATGGARIESYSGLERPVRRGSRSSSAARPAASRSARTTRSSPRPGGRHTWRRARARIWAGGAFAYLIQEYEPFTFPMGSLCRAGRAVLPVRALRLFSSELLREYFRSHESACTSTGPARGDRPRRRFRMRSPQSPRPPSSRARRPPSKRLLFYARPEPHAARNMFELGILALGRALEEGAFRSGWELRGIGGVDGARRLDLGGDVELELLPRAAQRDYGGGARRARRRARADVHAPPQPGPNRDGVGRATDRDQHIREQDRRGAGRHLAQPDRRQPTVEGIAGALLEAAAGVEDAERRADGSRVNWPRDWDEASMTRCSNGCSPASARPLWPDGHESAHGSRHGSAPGRRHRARPSSRAATSPRRAPWPAWWPGRSSSSRSLRPAQLPRTRGATFWRWPAWPPSPPGR